MMMNLIFYKLYQMVINYKKNKKKQEEFNVLYFKKQNELNNYISLILYFINYYYHFIN